MMFFGLPYFMGPSILILLPALVLAIYAQYKVRSTYARYVRVPTARRTSAKEAAQRLLSSAGVYDVEIAETKGPLTDNYDPRKKVLRLSDPESTSVAAIGVAAHEAGHAIQHAQAYRPLVLRTTIVPVANFGTTLAMPLFLFGLLTSYQPLMTIGILAFSVAVLFTLVTLPVEFDASRRAIVALRSSGIVSEEELGGAKEVLYAAALTYVAAAAMAALQLLMLISASRRRQ
jgi:hypothetical protein